MSDQFISAITDEAMTRICYAGGWNLTPYMFFISQTDVLEGWTDEQIFDLQGNVREEVLTFLKQYTTEQMQNDYTSGNVWYSNRFSSISQANSTTLTHHINIPGDVAIDTSSKEIKTIFFIYRDNAEQDFLYALARSNGMLIFEHGITQSFFFNFTVTNAATQDMTNFILNYSCAQEIEDHNTTWGPQIHSNLVARDGSRTLTGELKYENNIAPTTNNSLVDKLYVDNKFALKQGQANQTFLVANPTNDQHAVPRAYVENRLVAMEKVVNNLNVGVGGLNTGYVVGINRDTNWSAPADGWLYRLAQGGGYTMALQVEGYTITNHGSGTGRGTSESFFCPILKGQTVRWWGSGSCTFYGTKFTR